MDIQAWHPLTVHFPIAFLVLSGFLSLYLIFKFNLSLAKFNLGILCLGIIGCAVSIYTGNIEDGKVSRKLCDPTVLKDHENYAYYLLYTGLSILVFWLVKIFVFQNKYKLILAVIITISSITSLVFIVYVGHLGASLVYNQAAGVEVPSEDCINF